MKSPINTEHLDIKYDWLISKCFIKKYHI
jgi:hypothetical protein